MAGLDPNGDPKIAKEVLENHLRMNAPELF
jgi:hypothetical protein